MKEFRRVLAPGGHIVIFQANRWVWREPFTNDPMVHLLPEWIAPTMAKAFSWEHNVGRARYRSPPEMRRILRRAGFRKVRYGAPNGTELENTRVVRPVLRDRRGVAEVEPSRPARGSSAGPGKRNSPASATRP